MLIVMMISDLLIKGGQIKVTSEDGKVYVSIEGSARLAEEKKSQTLSVLKGNTQEVGAQDAPTLYLLEVCRAKGIRLCCSDSPVLHFILE